VVPTGTWRQKEKVIMAKVWLVTGSSRGLGRELAKAVLSAGDTLVATARDPQSLADIVGPHPDRAIAVSVDVTRAADAQRAVSAAVEKFGRIDVLVNNAGYANVAVIEDVDEADFRAQFETNFFGVFHMTRAVLPVMRAQRSGHVIQISSIGGRLGSPGLAAYQSAKWAVEGFTEVLSREVAAFGIAATLVEPGGMKTDWAGSSMQLGAAREAYQPVVAAFAHARQGATMRGDPAKAAQAILRVASAPRPPLRLLLGTDAVFLGEVVASKRAEEDAQWRALSVTTDFDGAVPFEDTEVAKAMLRK
jgi:NAD(P)-dependent dehydrogenase (short-subunit alcohol dehydrogenase family)